MLNLLDLSKGIMKNICLLIIDPQKDFCNKQGSLFVPGADKDMARLDSMIYGLSDKISKIFVSLDYHKFDSIFHECWYTDDNGSGPAPFDIISSEDLEIGKWHAVFPDTEEYTINYLKELENRGKSLVIWPYHCLSTYQELYVGEQDGASVVPVISEALHFYSDGNFGDIQYIVKGINRFTEQFSIFTPEAVDDSLFNRVLLEELENYDLILVSGEAGSHCVAESLIDMYCHFEDDESPDKVILISDTTSPVPGFKDRQKEVIKSLKAMGMIVKKTTNIKKYIDSIWE
jgi:nicotinamidase/pyrazinamidase